MTTTGTGRASTAITARQARPSPAGTSSERPAPRAPTETGSLPGDPAPAELSNQAMPGAAGATARSAIPAPPALVITGGHDDVP